VGVAGALDVEAAAVTAATTQAAAGPDLAASSARTHHARNVKHNRKHAACLALDEPLRSGNK